MNDSPKGPADRLENKLHHWGMIAGAVVLAFLLGLVPTWLIGRSTAAELSQSNAQLRKSDIQNILSSAIIDARRGEYEAARQETSEFYSRLRSEEEKGDEGFLTADQRTKIQTVFTDRDDVITTLAQRDPASLDRLTELYMRFRQTLTDVGQPNKK